MNGTHGFEEFVSPPSPKKGVKKPRPSKARRLPWAFATNYIPTLLKKD
jgi:hypothetical protein